MRKPYRTIFTVGLLMPVAAVALLVTTVRAADPLPLQLADGQAFRHVLETNDWLVLGRLYKTPGTSTGNTDSFTVTTTSGAFDDPIVLTNRVGQTTAVDFIVTETGVPTILTAFCALDQDEQTIDCTGTGLADASYTVEVEYRMGWDAYLSSDVIFRLYESDTATTLSERASPAGDYTLAGVYLTAAQVTALGVTWGDSDILLNTLASPNLWDTPADVTTVITWDTSATSDATETALTAAVQSYLVKLENDDPNVEPGDYVGTNGITLTGAVIAGRAFSLIQSAIPQAFASFEANVFPTAIATASTSMLDAVDAARAATAVYVTFQNIHPALGGALVFILSVLTTGLLMIKFKSTAVASSGWLVVFIGGWLIFNIPFQLVFITMAAIIALGFAYIGKRIFD